MGTGSSLIKKKKDRSYLSQYVCDEKSEASAGLMGPEMHKEKEHCKSLGPHFQTIKLAASSTAFLLHLSRDVNQQVTRWKKLERHLTYFRCHPYNSVRQL